MHGMSDIGTAQAVCLLHLSLAIPFGSSSKTHCFLPIGYASATVNDWHTVAAAVPGQLAGRWPSAEPAEWSPFPDDFPSLLSLPCSFSKQYYQDCCISRLDLPSLVSFLSVSKGQIICT